MIKKKIIPNSQSWLEKHNNVDIFRNGCYRMHRKLLKWFKREVI